MATFRGSGSVSNGAAFPTEAELQNAIDEAEAAAAAAAASQALAEINVTESETAQAAAEAAQLAAETAIPLAHAEVVLAQQAVTDATAQVVLAQAEVVLCEAEVVLCEDQVTLAAAQAVIAGVARTGAETAETNASAFATASLNSAVDAIAAKTAAELAYDNFDDRYLGAKSSDPTLDNDGNALLEGALYWLTTTPELKVYSGSVWTGTLLQATADTLYQPLDDELTDIALLAPTKGRLIAGNGSAWVDLGIGTDDEVLTADAAETVGMKWAAGSAIKTFASTTAITGWTTNSITSWTHGLGGIPDAYEVFLQCKVAQFGYAIGDRIKITPYYVYVGNWRGGTTFSTATDVGIVIRNYVLVYQKDTAAGNYAYNTHWDLYATAIKY